MERLQISLYSLFIILFIVMLVFCILYVMQIQRARKQLDIEIPRIIVRILHINAILSAVSALIAATFFLKSL